MVDYLEFHFVQSKMQFNAMNVSFRLVNIDCARGGATTMLIQPITDARICKYIRNSELRRNRRACIFAWPRVQIPPLEGAMIFATRPFLIEQSSFLGDAFDCARLIFEYIRDDSKRCKRKQLRYLHTCAPALGWSRAWIQCVCGLFKCALGLLLARRKVKWQWSWRPVFCMILISNLFVYCGRKCEFFCADGGLIIAEYIVSG